MVCEVFASNSGHFRINDFLLFFTLLLLLNYFLFNLFLFLQKSGGAKAPSAPPSARSLVTHLFILSSRLFAVALFTVRFKWWVTSVLILHCTVITICDRVWFCRSLGVDSNGLRLESFMFFCLHWLRDDSSVFSLVFGRFDEYERLIVQLVSNVLFVIENITMILLFYFSPFPHTWYSLPVTIYVCLVTVLGAVMRLTHFCFLTKSNNPDQVLQQQSHSNPVEVAAL